MNKLYIILIMLVFGFMTHKVLEEVYEYHFEKGFNSEICKKQYVNNIKNNVYRPLNERFKCTYKQMGAFRHLSYLLARPHFFSPSDKRWYY